MSYAYSPRSYKQASDYKKEKIIASVISFGVGALVGGLGGVFIFLNLTGGSAEPSQVISAPTLSLADIATPIESTPVESSEVESSSSETSVPAEETTQPEIAIPPTIYRIVSEESEARFSVYETFPEGTAIGRTNQIAGDILVDFNTPSNSQLGTIRINLRTLETGDPDRDKSIRCCVLLTINPEYEFADFVPTEISGFPEQVEIGQTVALKITGNLTLRGVTHPVTFDVTLNAISPEEVRGTATTIVNRSDFGILNNDDNGFDYHGVAEQVNLSFEFVARPVQ